MVVEAIIDRWSTALSLEDNMVCGQSLLTVDREALKVGHSTRRMRFKKFEETGSKTQSRERNCSRTTWLQRTFQEIGMLLLPSGRIDTKRRIKERTTHPILHIVAIPVQLSVSTPGPKYSTTDPVPPRTVKSPASLRITSFGAVHPLS